MPVNVGQFTPSDWGKIVELQMYKNSGNATKEEAEEIDEFTDEVNDALKKAENGELTGEQNGDNVEVKTDSKVYSIEEVMQFQQETETLKLGIPVEDPQISLNWEATSTKGHAFEKMAERKITQKQIDSWVKNPIITFSQSNGSKVAYLSENGFVVIAKDTGRVITAYSSVDFDSNIIELIKKLKKRGE